MNPKRAGWIFSAVFLSAWFVFSNIFIEKLDLFTAAWQGLLLGVGGSALSALATTLYMKYFGKRRNGSNP